MATKKTTKTKKKLPKKKKKTISRETIAVHAVAEAALIAAIGQLYHASCRVADFELHWSGKRVAPTPLARKLIRLQTELEQVRNDINSYTDNLYDDSVTVTAHSPYRG